MHSSSPQQPASQPETQELSLHERQRQEVLQSLAGAGQRPVAELADMSEAERCRWLFWNLHENLDELRLMEPILSARVTGAQFTVVDGSRLLGNGDMEKRLVAGHWPCRIPDTRTKSSMQWGMAGSIW
jgi:hypothetical protein